MRIGVTAKGTTLDSPVETRFGRCPYVIVVEGDTTGMEILPNPYAGESGGSGNRLVSLIASHRVDVVLTGWPGPNSFAALESAGIRIVKGCSGTVRQALDAFLGAGPGAGTG
ncbi:MAG: NifB/NifX family molybdenum-iron cluster-binding protein [Gemmatimonadetes bacterium]|nr:NifB/NifX family molybdenum-iron cluster-binding protein [Gemmatimonadota bacterium]